MTSKGKILEIVTPLHNATQRNCLERMIDNKVEAMMVAKKYDADYWDGDRRYGYGGYRYIPGRWRSVAQALIDKFGLVSGSKVLDVGCGKAFLLYEIQLINPEIELYGIDLSKYGLESAPKDLNAKLTIHRAQDIYPWGDNFFDLVISLGTLHNLHLNEIARALIEIERVGKSAYVMVESFRSEHEQFNLQCWALTAETLISVESWKWLYEKAGYSGYYEFIFF
jgi:SAM-dependent methyltransferase